MRLFGHTREKATVEFERALDDDGTINPTRVDNIAGLETLKTADLMVIFDAGFGLEVSTVEPAGKLKLSGTAGLFLPSIAHSRLCGCRPELQGG